jgi:PKHD-type hydroxylase
MQLYKTVKNLIEPSEALEIAEIIRNSPLNEGDDQVPLSRSYYNLNVCSILLGKLTEKVSKLSKKKLKPTYTYCRVYLKGAELKPHKDRPSCEYSVTLNLSQTEPWAIYMGKKGITQSPGDGVLYKGCEIEHSRKEFKGDEYIQVFLHYVDASGPYKDFVYDKKQPTYHYIFNVDSSSNHTDYYRFLKEISEENIDTLRNILDKQELVDAKVGEGTLDSSKRRSKIWWLPKTEEFFEIYKLLFNLVGQCNSQFYKFKLSDISEQIQYTVYDEGHYDWHLDMGPGKQRKLSLVVELSDPSEYEGGELQINTGQIIVPEKDKGTVIIFPSYLLHRVTPVTRGTRRSLVLWINGPPFE